MAKNVCTNKSLIKAEVNHYLELLRNAIAFNGRDYVPVYFAGVHQEALAEIQAMGIKVESKAGRWTTKFYAPKKGSKAWEALFKGSKVLDDAKAIADAKVKAAAAAAKEKAEKKAAKEKAKAEKEKAAAKAAKEKAKAAKVKAETKAAKPKKNATTKVEAAPKAEKKAKVAKPKAEKKAKVEKKAATPKAEVKTDAPKVVRGANGKFQSTKAAPAAEAKAE